MVVPFVIIRNSLTTSTFISVVNATFDVKQLMNVAKHKNLIITTIMKSEPEGIHVSDLVKITKLDKATVSRLCNILQYQDLVIYKKNKQAPYHLTDKMYGDFRIKAFLFQKHIKNKIRNHLPLDSDEKTISEFGNRISALVIYSMLQALEPKNEKLYLGSQLKKETMQLPIKEAMHKILINKSWIESVNIEDIFQQFCHLIRGHLTTFIDLRKRKKEIPFLSDYLASRELDKKTYDKLIKIFANIYPDFYKEIINAENDVNGMTEHIYKRKKLRYS
jgi:hypothetical protein